MRARLAIILASLLAVASASLFLVAPASATTDLLLAQEVGEDQGDANVDEGDTGGTEGTEGTGQSDEEAESGVDEGESGGAVEETGPPWTYQMARMALGIVFLVFLMVGFTYYQFVWRRQKGAA